MPVMERFELDLLRERISSESVVFITQPRRRETLHVAILRLNHRIEMLTGQDTLRCPRGMTNTK